MIRSQESTFFLEFFHTHPEWQNHVAFTTKAALDWRERFRYSSHWAARSMFADKARRVLKLINPPFFPEDELVIWDPGVDPKPNTKGKFIRKLVSNRLSLEEGFCFATDFRVIWGNKNEGTVAQALYGEIKRLTKRDNRIELVLDDSDRLEFLFAQNKAMSISANRPAPNQECDPLLLVEEFFNLVIKYREISTH